MNLERPAPHLVALEELLLHAWIAGGGCQCRQPILVRDDVVDHGAGLITPGQRTAVGTRKPPSQFVVFSPQKDVWPPSGR